jgi:hypothetical protein
MMVAVQVVALAPGDRVGDFRLMDHTGGSHDLHYFGDMNAVVIVAQSNRCDESTRAMSRLDILTSRYGDSVKVFMINSDADRRQSRIRGQRRVDSAG